MRITSTFLVLLAASAGLAAQKATLTLESVERQMPAYIQERLSPQDRVLFDKLMRVGLESAWSLVTAEGYPQELHQRAVAPEGQYAHGGPRAHHALSPEP